MANYFTQVVVQPEIPSCLLDEKMREQLQACGLTCAYDERAATYYLYSEEWVGSDADDVHYEDVLQEIVVNSDGAIPYLTVQAALTCSKPRPNGFGGYALVITAGEIKSVDTSLWVSTTLREMSGD